MYFCVHFGNDHFLIKTTNRTLTTLRGAPVNENQNNKSLSHLSILLGLSCGFIVANIYYSQPLITPISEEMNIGTSTGSLLVTLNQLGYGLGLLLLVPLADIVRNKRLISILLMMTAVALLGMATTHIISILIISALFIGIGASSVQILVPYAAHMAPEAARGQVVGNVMSGLMAGIMFARPFASVLAEFFMWQMVFYVSSVLMISILILLSIRLPERLPAMQTSYFSLLASMAEIWKNTSLLRRRSIYHFFLFAAFSLFWTTIPLLLSGPIYKFNQGEIALFAFVGAAGVLAAPIAGKVADCGLIRAATLTSMIFVSLCFIIPFFAPFGSKISIALFVVAAILLDFGVTTNLIVGQKVIYGLASELRGRLNGIYMVVFFMGGALGSAIGGQAYSIGGWAMSALVGLALPIMAIIYFITEK